eukprot:COSAG01_NODE_41313_length_453_cov_0.870056_1_plen_30_part_10
MLEEELGLSDGRRLKAAARRAWVMTQLEEA